MTMNVGIDFSAGAGAPGSAPGIHWQCMLNLPGIIYPTPAQYPKHNVELTKSCPKMSDLLESDQWFKSYCLLHFTHYMIMHLHTNSWAPKTCQRERVVKSRGAKNM